MEFVWLEELLALFPRPEVINFYFGMTPNYIIRVERVLRLMSRMWLLVYDYTLLHNYVTNTNIAVI